MLFCAPGERVELLALDVFGRACDRDVAVTVAVVADRLAQLASHRASCRCGRCDWLRGVSAVGVWRVLEGWQVVEPEVVVEPDLYGSHVCAQCGRPFAAVRYDAQYCGAACRIAACRSRR